MNAPEPIVSARALSKRFGDVQAVRDLTLDVQPGELFGLIGADGAGKTTLIRMWTSLITPTSGSSRVLGLDPVADFRALRGKIGYMPGRFSLYTDLTVNENLEFFASVFGTTPQESYARIADVFALLEPFRNRRAGALSGGMKQKLALSCALIHAPRVLFLDEPTTGVDAVSRREFWDVLELRRREGMTIVVSTPYMDEAARCDRVALLHEGAVLEVAPPAEMTARFALPLLRIETTQRAKVLNTLRRWPETHLAYFEHEVLHLSTLLPEAVVVERLRDAGFPDALVHPTPAGIEDVFLHRLHELTS